MDYNAKFYASIKYIWSIFSVLSDLKYGYQNKINNYGKHFEENAESIRQMEEQRRNLLNLIENILNSIKELYVDFLCKKLCEWKNEQLMACSGDRVLLKSQNETKLPLCEIENLFSEVFDLLNSVGNVLTSLREFEICETFKNQLNKLQLNFDRIQETLVRACFIVENQPPQVIKKNTK